VTAERHRQESARKHTKGRHLLSTLELSSSGRDPNNQGRNGIQLSEFRRAMRSMML
jgi:hypothetical protein